MLKLEKKIQQELDIVLNQEELLWFQKSREKWITSGDRNTRYYQASTLAKRDRNRTDSLRLPSGEWVSDPTTLENLATYYYKKMFIEKGSDLPDRDIPAGFPTLTEEELSMLSKPITNVEIQQAMFIMAAFKSPRVNGLHVGFYQNLWSVVGESVCNFAREFFESGILSEGINDTLLALVPNVQHPEPLAQLRPISVCNVSYKVITKTLTNRLKGIMGSIIGPNQCNFVPGRHITDNILIYQEVLHSMRKKRTGEGFMMIKIDLEKANA